jgi:alpha-1,3-glucan synthase
MQLLWILADYASMGDLIGFEGFLNASTPFDTKEHKALYKSSVTYADFTIGNTYNANCEYPRFWNASGERVRPEDDSTFATLAGCFNSEFDQVCLTLP